LTTQSPSRSSSPPEGRKTRAALSRDLSEFLLDLSIAVHRFAMYPPDHPSLRPAAENVIRSLTDILQDRPQLGLGVARRQLVIEGIATDEKHPVLSDLARRLHGHQLGSVRFERGVAVEELVEVLVALSEDPERGGEPLGLLPAERRPAWKHIRLLPIGYDELELSDEQREVEDRPRAQQLWIGLAQAALKTNRTDDPEVLDGRALAGVIEDRGGDEAYDKVIVGYLHQLAEELNGAQGAEAAKARRHVSELAAGLEGETLARLLQLGGAYPQRKRFLLDMNHADLAVGSVVRILEAAAKVEGQSISTSLTRLLGKLATHADGTPKRLRAEAETAIRDTVEDLISNWELEDPNPDAYTQVLDRMAQAAPMLQDDVAEGEELPGSERIIQMALELDAGGPTVDKAVLDLLDDGRIAELFRILDQAPEGSRMADQLMDHLTSPAQLQRLLGGDAVDERSLRALVDRIGPGAVEPLFQYLVESESRSVRRRAFDCLAALGLDLGDKILEHLRDERWFVQRNMLALLQAMNELPEGFSPMEHLEAEDPRVRRAALPLALRDPALRDRALAGAFRDPDERIVRIALLEVQDELPDTLAPVMVSRVLRTGTFPQLRSLAARALGANRSSLAREALLDLCFRKRWLLRRGRLAAGSPELLAALAVLARDWGDDPRGGRVLELARKSRDPQIRAAAGFGEDEG
jgi:hypothetical protein